MKIYSITLFCIQLIASTAFLPPGIQRYHLAETKLFAEGGAPQYDKVEAKLSAVEVVGKGSVLLHIDSDTPVDYKAGHVLALEIEAENNFLESNKKNAEDAKKNEGWMRGPYTVSRATEKSFDILIKVVGDKSKRFANAEAGSPVKFGGKFKVPIVEGIQKEDTKRVVLISTGVGAGPCVGAIEEALKDGSFPAIKFCACYRDAEEIVYGDYLDKLQEQNPECFSWNAHISSENGRLSANEKNLQAITSEEFDLHDTHYHLIGNGQMVGEFKAGLNKAGVSDDKVTIENYFNHQATLDDNAIERIANVISSKKTAEALL